MAYTNLAPQVQLRGEVGVHVVVDEGRIFVRAGHTVEVEVALVVPPPERRPQTCRLDQNLKSGLALEGVVTGGAHVVDHRAGDIGVDVHRGRACGPIAGALPSVDRPPGERGALQTQHLRAIARVVQGVVPPSQGLLGRFRGGVREHREHKPLEVPEGVPLVSGTGEAFAGHRPPFNPNGRLVYVEERKPDCLLQSRFAIHLNICTRPKFVETLALALDQAVPPRLDGLVHGVLGTITQGSGGQRRRPLVSDELHDVDAFARLQRHGDGGSGEVGCDLRENGRIGCGRCGHNMVHRDGDSELAVARLVHQLVDALQRPGHRFDDPRVGMHVGLFLVRDHLGLHGDGDGLIDRLHLVVNGRDRALGEGDESGGDYAHRSTRGRGPLQFTAQGSRLKVQALFVRGDPAVPNIQRLVPHEESDDLPIGHVDDALPARGVAVALLRVRHRMFFEHTVEVATRDVVRLSLVEVSAPADVAVGESENRLAVRQLALVQAAQPDAPRRDVKGKWAAHGSPFFATFEDRGLLSEEVMAARESCHTEAEQIPLVRTAERSVDGADRQHAALEHELGRADEHQPRAQLGPFQADRPHVPAER
jgi:hypothetical protein